MAPAGRQGKEDGEDGSMKVAVGQTERTEGIGMCRVEVIRGRERSRQREKYKRRAREKQREQKRESRREKRIERAEEGREERE
jgi:hypothetical protein